jgi:hypothetical protein
MVITEIIQLLSSFILPEFELVSLHYLVVGLTPSFNKPLLLCILDVRQVVLRVRVPQLRICSRAGKTIRCHSWLVRLKIVFPNFVFGLSFLLLLDFRSDFRSRTLSC